MCYLSDSIFIEANHALDSSSVDCTFVLAWPLVDTDIIFFTRVLFVNVVYVRSRSA